MTNEIKVRPFGLRDKFGYMFGDFGNDFTFILSSMLLMKFYTDVMGVDAKIIGLMMLVSKILDAFTDIAMGQIVDRSNATKKGKFLPWIKRIAGPVALASVLMYPVWFQNMSMTFKIIWMFGSYFMWGSIFYTAINIPYGSMASAITFSPEERTQLSTFRSVGATLASLFIGIVTPYVVYYKNELGHTVMSGTRTTLFAFLCSVLAVLCYAFCYALTTERVKIKKDVSKFSIISIFSNMFSSRALIGLILISIGGLIGLLTVGTMNNYLYPNYFSNAGAMAWASILGTGITLTMATIAPKMAAKYGKKELVTIGSLLSGAAMLIAYFLQIQNVLVFLVFVAVMGVGNAFFGLLCWAMIVDIIDDLEIKNGNRNDGTIYASYSFARKLSQAAAAGLTGYLLSFVGYTVKTQNDPTVVKGIYNIATLLPAAMYIFMALIAAFVYNLDKTKVNNNAQILQNKHNN